MIVQNTVLRRLFGGAANYNLILGFIPSYVEVTVMEGTNPVTYRWYGKQMQESLVGIADSTEFGIKRTGADGVETYMDTVAKGISAYDGSKIVQVLIENPATGKGEGVTPSDFLAGDTQPTARTASAVGTVKRPSTHNDYVYECTVSAGVLGTEPTTWPTVPGETVSDGTNTWICREENIVAGEGLGITLGGTLLTNDEEVFIVAVRDDSEVQDIGDIG